MVYRKATFGLLVKELMTRTELNYTDSSIILSIIFEKILDEVYKGKDISIHGYFRFKPFYQKTFEFIPHGSTEYVTYPETLRYQLIIPKKVKDKLNELTKTEGELKCKFDSLKKKRGL